MDLREELARITSETINGTFSTEDEKLADKVAKLIIQHDLNNGTKIEHHPPEFYDTLDLVAKDLVSTLRSKGAQYGNSWISRGGVGAFMMLTRKYDRIVNQLKKDPQFDIIEHAQIDQRDEGLTDDVKDLCAYLLLVLTYLKFQRG
jgi:hypothetical protein